MVLDRDGVMRFFKKVEESDIWITSPVTLNQKIDNKDRNIPFSDYLSSIEILVIYRLDVILMQNWQHLLNSNKINLNNLNKVISI